MKLAIMQPYFLPYLGYFQLLQAADKFVFFDDVNYIKKGWINKNQILVNNQAYKFTIPLIKASQNKLINEVHIADYKVWREDFMKLIELNYKKAPHFSSIYHWLKELLYKKEYETISDLASESVMAAGNLLDINVEFSYSTNLDYAKSAGNGQEKILSICKLLGGTEYINPYNGAELYNNADFVKAEVILHFLKMNEIRYTQLKKDEFIPYLSILDVLMLNEIDTIKQFLNNYSLINAQ